MACTVITKSEQELQLARFYDFFLKIAETCYSHCDFPREKKVDVDVLLCRQVNADGGDVSGGCVLGRG